MPLPTNNTQGKHANQPFNLAELDEAALISEPKTQPNAFEFSMDDLQAYIDGDPVSQMIRAANKKAAQARQTTQSAA